MEINPVKGTHDIYGDESLLYYHIERICQSVAELYCYNEIRTPIIEHTNLFARSVGESSDIVTKEMYTFKDKGDRSITLRPELTAGVMRSIVSNKLYVNADLPLKYFYMGPCFRYERPQAGRYRQFHQFGVEAIGNPSFHLDAEVIALGFRVFSAIGLEGMTVKINSLGDEESRDNYRKALKEYFAKHIDKMCEDCKRRYEINPLRILDCKVPEDIEIVKGAPKLRDYLSDSAKVYLDSVIADLESIGIKPVIDDTLVRGLDYYTGVVWEYHFEDPEFKGVGGAVGGGGHYGKLLAELGGPELEGVGMSIGLERLVSIVKQLITEKFPTGPDYYFIGMTEEIVEKLFGYMDFLRRNAGLSCECNFEVKSFKSLFKTAIRREAKFVVIVGEDEDAKNQLTVKNLRTQEQTTVEMEDAPTVLRSMLEEYMNTYFGDPFGQEEVVADAKIKQ